MYIGDRTAKARGMARALLRDVDARRGPRLFFRGEIT